MRPRSARPPIVVIGMHRSGTSMLGSMLEEAGLFLGWRQQPEHQEAAFFQELNEWLLHQAGGSWDHPGPFDDLLGNAAARDVATSYLRYSLRSPRAVSYLGPTRYLQFRDIAGQHGSWGWKDPRSTYTLPMWLDLFPEAKVVHVMRHGVDVSRSLQVRSEAMLASSSQLFEKKKWHYLFRARRTGFTAGLRFLRLEDGLALWDDYTVTARRHVEALGERAHEFRYEDFLMDPVERMVQLMEFCGLGAPTPALKASLASVNPSRAFAYKQSPEMEAFAEDERVLLARHGY